MIALQQIWKMGKIETEWFSNTWKNENIQPPLTSISADRSSHNHTNLSARLFIPILIDAIAVRSVTLHWVIGTVHLAPWKMFDWMGALQQVK